jgi:hypothetical protein
MSASRYRVVQARRRNASNGQIGTGDDCGGRASVTGWRRRVVAPTVTASPALATVATDKRARSSEAPQHWNPVDEPKNIR